jgi:hypothetical protein
VAEVTIRLVVDPTTRKKNVIISYTSDSDALPIEHEDAHREVVDKLIEGGALAAAELGKIIIDRESRESGNLEESEETQRESISEGNS